MPTKTLAIFEAEEWYALFGTLHDDPQALSRTVGELRRIVDFYEVCFTPSFEEATEHVRTQSHNKNDCGHAPSSDQVAYRVLTNAIGVDIIVHMSQEFQQVFWSYLERKSPH